MNHQVKILALTAAVIFIAGLAAAPAQAFIYYTASSGTVGRANLDGSHANNNFVHQESKSFMNGPGLGLDFSDGSHLYWSGGGTTDQADNPNLDGFIERSNLNGTGMTKLVSGVSGTGTVVDSSHLYFVNYNGTYDTIARANLDGSGLNLSFLDLPAWSSDGGPGGIVIGGGYIYWFDGSRIGRANVDGSNPQDRFITGVGGSLVEGFGIDSGHLYWDSNYSGGVGSISRVNLDGTGLNKNFISGLSLPQGVGVEDGHIYWTQGAFNDRSVRRADLNGQHVQTLVKASAISLVLDALGSTGGGKSAKKKCTVPSLSGSTLKKAKSKLRNAHCAVGKVTRRKAPGKPGRVLSTHPATGSTRPRGSKVSLVLSRH